MQNSISSSCMMNITTFILIDGSMFLNYGYSPMLRKHQRRDCIRKEDQLINPFDEFMFLFCILFQSVGNRLSQFKG